MPYSGQMSGNPNSLITHVEKFMAKARIFPPSRQAWAGVSGGRDSMLLLYCLERLRRKGVLKTLQVLHVIHRDSGPKIPKVIRSFCQELKIPYREVALSPPLDFQRPNFEKQAREARYREFSRRGGKGDLFYLGHHLDDSFEWSLLQSWRSSTLRPSLGIPVRRGRFARPFMCLSRQQITFWAKRLSLPFEEDQSNSNERFERNYIRREIVPKIRNRYPQYLKHYAIRSNTLALQWGRSAFYERGGKGKVSQWQMQIRGEGGGGGFSLVHPHFGNDFAGAEEVITDLIAKLSKTGRGKLARQVEKMVDASRGGREGPLAFSGGVQGYIHHGILLFLPKGGEKHYFQQDEGLAAKLAILTSTIKKGAQIPDVNFFSAHAHAHKDLPPFFPHWVFSLDERAQSICPGKRTIHPLWPQATQMALEKGIWFHGLYRLLHCWSKKGGRGHLKIVPFNHLDFL